MDSFPGYVARSPQVHCLRGVDVCPVVQPEWRTTGTSLSYVRSGRVHAFLHGSYMTKLRAFTVQAKAEGRRAYKRDRSVGSSLRNVSDLQRGVCQRDQEDASPHCMSRQGNCLLVQMSFQLPLRLPWMSYRLYLARICMDGGPLGLRSIFA